LFLADLNSFVLRSLRFSFFQSSPIWFYFLGLLFCEISFKSLFCFISSCLALGSLSTRMRTRRMVISRATRMAGWNQRSTS